MRRSRLTKRTEKRTQKTIILSVLGIIIVLYFLFKFGVEMLINFSLFLSSTNKQQVATNSNSISFIPAPILNPLPTATNSAKVIISGTADKGKTILLYMNNTNVDQTTSDGNGNFNFTETLNPGNNQISTKETSNSKQSDFSNVINVTYSNTPPTLDVTSPTDGEQFSKDQNTALVSGKTDPGVTVTVNGYWAVIDENNNFSYNLPLQNGDNEIKIIATDQAGNKTEKDIKVNYSQ